MRSPGNGIDCREGCISMLYYYYLTGILLTASSMQAVLFYSLPSRVLGLRLTVGLLLLARDDFSPYEHFSVISSRCEYASKLGVSPSYCPNGSVVSSERVKQHLRTNSSCSRACTSTAAFFDVEDLDCSVARARRKASSVPVELAIVYHVGMPGFDGRQR